MLFHRLFPAAVFSLTLALTGCGGMDDTLSPHIKPDGGSNNGGSSGGSNNGGNTGGSNNGGNTGGSNNGGSNGGSNNGGSDNGGGDNSTNPPVANCPLPDNSYLLSTLGNTDELATYELTAYSKANAASSLAGTWVLIANTSAQTPAQSSRSAQKYLFVIKDTTTTGEYNVGNCSGTGLISTTYSCIDALGQDVACDGNQHQNLPPLISYQPWQALIDAKIETKDSKQFIHLPLFDADFGHPEQGIELELIGSDFNELKSTDEVYQALKISDNTNPLGTSTAFGDSASPVWCTVQVKAESNSCSSNPDLRLISVFATTDANQHKLLTGEGATALQLSKIFADATKGDGRNSNDYAGSIQSSAITTGGTQVKLSFSIDQSGTTRSINLDVDASASR